MISVTVLNPAPEVGFVGVLNDQPVVVVIDESDPLDFDLRLGERETVLRHHPDIAGKVWRSPESACGYHRIFLAELPDVTFPILCAVTAPEEERIAHILQNSIAALTAHARGLVKMAKGPPPLEIKTERITRPTLEVLVAFAVERYRAEIDHLEQLIDRWRQSASEMGINLVDDESKKTEAVEVTA